VLIGQSLPNGLVVLDLPDGVYHLRQEVADALEEGKCKDGHEADLPSGKLEDVSKFRRPSEQGCFHSDFLLHLTLVGELLLEDVCPLLRNPPRPSLENPVPLDDGVLWLR